MQVKQVSCHFLPQALTSSAKKTDLLQRGHFGALAAGLIAVVFFIAAAASDDWNHGDSGTSSLSIAPYYAESSGTKCQINGCKFSSNGNCPGSLFEFAGSDCDKLRTAQSFVVIGAIASGVGFILVLAGGVLSTSAFPNILGAIAFIVAGVAGLIAMSDWSGWIDDGPKVSTTIFGATVSVDIYSSKPDYGWGFALLVIAWIVSFVAGAASLATKRCG